MGAGVEQVNLPLGQADGKNLHLEIINGLNLKAVCSNLKCKGSTTRTWIHLGYGTFNIAQ
jgi:hypothetical protein